MLRNPCPRPHLNVRSQARFRTPQRVHPFAQPQGVQLINGECSMATLRASHPAHKPFPGPPRSIFERTIDNLHKSGIARGELHKGKDTPTLVFVRPRTRQFRPIQSNSTHP
jgi:hypothetical protein